LSKEPSISGSVALARSLSFARSAGVSASHLLRPASRSLIASIAFRYSSILSPPTSPLFVRLL
jgi:hypothetical protein